VSGAFGYQETPGGPVETPAPSSIADLVRWLLDLGAATVTVSDLQGVASPERTAERLAHLLAHVGPERLGYHGHHPDPVAGLDLARAAWQAGVRLFDGSLGATGGCITGAPGNLPTEGLAEALAALGADTGLDPAALRRAAADFHAAR
jgi:hydroxymethylglutaryl-CoA lyase